MKNILPIIAKSQPTYLDSSVFIYAFENHPKYKSLTRPLFNALSDSKLKAVTSIITITEVLTIPLKEKESKLVNTYLEVFSKLPNLDVLLPSYWSAVEAAKIRAKYNFTLPDSYQLALAREAKCKSLITNDKNLLKFKEIKMIHLDSYA